MRLPQSLQMSEVARYAAICLVLVTSSGVYQLADAKGQNATSFKVDLGTYMAAEPAGWDGSTALPAAVYFHGWQSTAKAVMNNEAMRQSFSRAGVLLIAPDGLHKTWAHNGSPAHRFPDKRDEIAFVDQVLLDVKARWPVDERRLWATGFSQGGSMVWDAPWASNQLRH